MGINTMPVSELIEQTSVMMQNETRDEVCTTAMRMTNKQMEAKRKKNEAREAGGSM